MSKRPLSSPSEALPSVELMGIKVHRAQRQDLMQQIAFAAEHGHGGNINNVNIHAMNLAWIDPEFRAILNHSDQIIVDGAGVLAGAKIIGQALGERLPTVDFLDDLISDCLRNNWSLFWLGDTDEVGAAFEKNLTTRYPQLNFAGRHHGFFAKEGPESDRVVEQINASGAKILLVGMSMPLQEKWLWRNREQLLPPVRLACGGAARVVIGDIRRGPRWMTDNGLEWLYRLCMQPRYTWRRYIIGNPLFLIRLLGWRHLGWRPKSQ